VVVTAIREDGESSVGLAQRQVEGEVATGDRDDGIAGIGIAA
jgi:hypothetical protein